MRLDYDVIVIGSGPSGIAVATELKRQGITNIVVLERESKAGGVPRHCHHPTFGLLTFKRPMMGPKFVDKILTVAGQLFIMTNTTVVEIRQNGQLLVSCDQGLVEMQAKRVVIATGARETPRHPRLVSGLRPQGILTTGALQQFVYLNRQKPCTSPVIIGSEIVSFSALWTLRNAGIRAKAMIEVNNRITANRPLSLVASIFNVPLYLESKLIDIGGLDRVEYVLISVNGQTQRIDCDAVIFTGQFIGENTLIRSSHLDYIADTGCPAVDLNGCCSDPTYYALGNMLHPADMGDQCYLEGKKIGQAIVNSLQQHPPTEFKRLPIQISQPIQFTVPNCINTHDVNESFNLNIRVSQAITGQVLVKAGDTLLYQRQHRCLPGRRVMLKGVNAGLIPLNATEINVTIV